jgi:FlaA1/EpsC-like NDP-sugar epimerase
MAAGIRNNVFGTLNTVYAAIQGDVENFVLISSDKAVRPINIMGASKRLAELILQSLSAEDVPDFSRLGGIIRKGKGGSRITRFTIVRFGNVLGSSGSVIPKFRKQIQNGGPVTVTHPDVTRYFMTMDEAAQLVIQASSMGAGGDVFILDMGKPVKILDLAVKMIRLSGQSPRSPSNPTGDIEIVFTGLRPGEKLHEQLHTGEEAFPTGHPKVFRAQENFPAWPALVETLLAIQTALERNDLALAKNLLIRCVGGDDEPNLAEPDAASPARKPNVVPLNPRMPN